jgi:putative nucleotidyltransferase with HDIG domain
MKPAGERRKAFVERVGTVTIDMDAYEKAGVDTSVLKMVIDKIEDLPPLPLIVQKVLSLTQSENTNTEELAKVISNDQALTAKLLRIVNSPFYAVSSVVTTIPHAVILLGFRGVRDLALGLSTVGLFKEYEESRLLPRQRFWEHSIASALCCKAVADRIRHKDPEEAFVGGLLHDIGRMVFSQFFSGSFTDALREASMKRQPLLDLEKEEIGISHTLVGKLLLQKWNLPPSLADAVERHHDPSLTEGPGPTKVDIPLIIMVANTLTKIANIGFGGDRYIYSSGQGMWSKMPIREEEYVAFTSNLSREVGEIKGFFGIKDSLPPSDQLLANKENGEPPRLAFYKDAGLESFIPTRLMLRRFFQVESFPLNGDIKGSIEQAKPHAVFVDLSSEQSHESISETLKAYRSATTSPIIFLLSRKVSKETEEKSARIGVFFLSTPLCPQEVHDCLGQITPSTA